MRRADLSGGPVRTDDHDRITRRCQRCHKDISVAWLECVLKCGHLSVEERFHLWDILKSDHELRLYREQKQKLLT